MSDSGHIWLDGDVIRYRSSAYGDWDLRVRELRILGECTNQSGPFADDYFFCFAIAAGNWLEASFYAEGRDDFLAALGARLGVQLQPELCASADFASRIMWPLPLADQPMFQYSEMKPTGRLTRLLGLGRVEQALTDPVAAALKIEPV